MRIARRIYERSAAAICCLLRRRSPNYQTMKTETQDPEQSKPDTFPLSSAVAPNESRRVLYLPLKRRWFDAIKHGTKTEEYRLCTDYWRRRLYKQYDEIEFSLGYPKRDDSSRRMRFKFGGVYRREVTSPEWGNEPQQVYAIRIGDAVATEGSGRHNGAAQLSGAEERTDES